MFVLRIAFAITTLTAIQQTADVRVSNAHLQTACVDGKPSDRRTWELAQRETTMVFTMRNQPRLGRDGAEAGFAAITFTPEPGHTYEIEVRAEPSHYSDRVWPKGAWRPVVRDRTTDRIVSSAPRWVHSPCADSE